MTIDEMLNSIRIRYKQEELSRAMLREWYDLSLPLILRYNKNKPKTDCWNLLLSGLSDIQTSLPTQYHSETTLKNKVLNL